MIDENRSPDQSVEVDLAEASFSASARDSGDMLEHGAINLAPALVATCAASMLAVPGIAAVGPVEARPPEDFIALVLEAKVDEAPKVPPQVEARASTPAFDPTIANPPQKGGLTRDVCQSTTSTIFPQEKSGCNRDDSDIWDGAMFRPDSSQGTGRIRTNSPISYLRSGLYTGPSDEIGGSSPYHIDTKFSRGLIVQQRVALMDAMALGYETEGRRIEFSNEAVAGLVWDVHASPAEKIALLQRAELAHSHSVHRDWTSVDYYIPLKGQSRSGGSVRNAEMLLPKVPGTKIEFDTASNYGNFAIMLSQKGTPIMKTGHGANSKTIPRNVSFPPDIAARTSYPLLSRAPFSN